MFNVSAEHTITKRLTKAINGMEANKTHWISPATYLPRHDSDTQRTARLAKTGRQRLCSGWLFSWMREKRSFPCHFPPTPSVGSTVWCVLCAVIFKMKSCREHNKWNNVISHLTIYITTASGECRVSLEEMKKKSEKSVEKTNHRHTTF